MLVLSRRDGEEIVIGKDVVIKVLASNGGRVRIGIEAPRSVAIRRAELCQDMSDDHAQFRGTYAPVTTEANISMMAGCIH
jgi:carbon storage regulator CsrA